MVPIDPSSQHPILHAGFDEAGSLTAETPFFTVAAVFSPRPETLRHVIAYAALRAGKRLRRARKAASELKWSNASRRLRTQILTDLGQAEVELFALTVLKSGRRIEDTPENYATLICELLSHCWHAYPDVALLLDRHFTSPAQVAVVNTMVHRRWPQHGTLSVTHIDSQRSHMVQLADIVAGSVYSWHKSGDDAVGLIENRFGARLVEDWRHVKARWLAPDEAH